MISFLRVSHPLSVRPLVGQTRQPSRTTEKIMNIFLKPKVTLHCIHIYYLWVLVSGILNVFNSY